MWWLTNGIADPESHIPDRKKWIISVWWELQSAWPSLRCLLLPKDFRRLILKDHSVTSFQGVAYKKKEDVKTGNILAMTPPSPLWIETSSGFKSSITSTILLLLFCNFCLAHICISSTSRCFDEPCIIKVKITLLESPCPSVDDVSTSFYVYAH